MVRTVPQAQTREKKKPEFLIIPSIEGNARADSLQQVTSHGQWHWLLPTASFSCALVLSSGGIISLKADKASSSWSSGPHNEAPGEAAHYATPMLLGELWERGEEMPEVLLLYALKIAFKKHKLQTSSF